MTFTQFPRSPHYKDCKNEPFLHSYLLIQIVDFDQTYMETPLGHGKEMIRFWWPWPHFDEILQTHWYWCSSSWDSQMPFVIGQGFAEVKILKIDAGPNFWIVEYFERSLHIWRAYEKYVAWHQNSTIRWWNYIKAYILETMELNLCQKSRHVNNGQFKSKRAILKITPV